MLMVASGALLGVCIGILLGCKIGAELGPAFCRGVIRGYTHPWEVFTKRNRNREDEA